MCVCVCVCVCVCACTVKPLLRGHPDEDNPSGKVM